MIALLWIALVIAIAIMLGLFIGALTGDVQWLRRDPTPRAQVQIALHSVRRRLETFLLRGQIQSEAAQLRRQLDRELRDFNEQGGF